MSKEEEKREARRPLFRFLGFHPPDNGEKIVSRTGHKEAIQSEDGVWIYGDAGVGKTFCMYHIIRKMIDDKKRWVGYSAYDLAPLIDYHSKEGIKFKLNEYAMNYFIDDIDKMGNMTIPRQEKVFALMDQLLKLKYKLFVTANVSISKFCNRLTLEFRQSIERRLGEMCKEIHIGG